MEQYLLGKSIDDYSGLIDAVYRYYGSQVGTEEVFRWGDKNNFYLKHVFEITQVFPNAKFIHIIRDGRDVAASYKEISSKHIESNYAPKLFSRVDDIAVEWTENNLKIINGLTAHCAVENWMFYSL